jgi:hypothetical protein
MTSVR